MEKAEENRPGRRAALVVWGSAFALYVLAYTSAILLSSSFGFTKSLLGGLANSLPDALAAPLVLRVASGCVRRRAWGSLVFAGAGFVAWSALAATLGLMIIRGVLEGVWAFAIDPRSFVWKALMSLLAFGVLAGVGLSLAFSREAREASARALKAETLRAESRLAILRAQLNPHFILNVLHSLVGLAERDPRATAAALERLGTTLRYALRVQSRGSDRVALREELAFTREYLELERLRLGDRLEARFEVDEAALGAGVPPFVLQPLVENAVLHAIAPRARGGVVSIGVARDAETLVLRVEDDGAPDSAAVNAAGPSTAAAPAEGPSRGAGLGLGLLRDRLTALYGSRGAVETDRSPLGGRRVTLRLTGEPDVPGEEAE